MFTTGKYDGLLNHSCGHTLFGPFASVGSSPNAEASAPDISMTHVEYTVTLRPNEGVYSGWVRAQFPTQGPYRLYFDAATTVTLSDSDGTMEEAVPLSPTPLACPGITHELTLTPSPYEDLFLRLGPDVMPSAV